MGKNREHFAFRLARTGQHRCPVRLQQLQRDSGIVNVRGERASVQVTDTLDEQIPYDLVIVTLLAYQVEAVLPALQRSAVRCALGMPFVQPNFDGDGKQRTGIPNLPEGQGAAQRLRGLG